MEALSAILKALADTNRLRILSLLAEQPLCVCDLETALQLNQSNLSRHLSRLRDVGLVESRKQGLFVHYSAISLPGVAALPVGAVVEAARQSEHFSADLQRLRKYRCCL